jgi:acetylornithine deacetylase
MIDSPTVVFGPGSINQAHTCDEWIEIEQLHRATDMLTEFGRLGGLRPEA